VSIDSADEETHDNRRNKKGLFRKAVRGLIAARKAGLITAISCCIKEEQLQNGDFENLIKLGKRLGVNELFVFEMIPVGACNRNKNCYQSLNLSQAMKIADKYNRDNSYPGIVFYQYIADKFSLGCSGGISYLYISPYGEVYPCDFHDKCYGNVRTEELPYIWERMSREAERTCIGCKMKKKDLL
jgi:MoaA/NifB/PqqE/SkfB family radical SAM enzyme